MIIIISVCLRPYVHMLSASRRQPHLLHVSAVDRRQTWSMDQSWRGEAGINVHDVLPVTTPRGEQMMPPADRIYGPGQGAKKDLTDTGDDFLAI